MSSATYVDPASGMKTFVPLENNPEVMSKLARRLGLSSKVGFYDVYSIDDPDLLAFVPRPVFALIVIVPGGPGGVYTMARGAENQRTPKYEGSGPDEPVIWIKQTIGHACGLMAFLHSTVNGEAKAFIEPGTILANLRDSFIPLKPAARAKLLYDSTEVEMAHQQSAQEGDSTAPAASEDNNFAFLSFVKGDDGHLWELFGGDGANGPLNRGQLAEDEDVLSEKALDLSLRSFIIVAQQAGVKDLQYSIVALGPALD